jgi:hypothetical protein
VEPRAPCDNHQQHGQGIADGRNVPAPSASLADTTTHAPAKPAPRAGVRRPNDRGQLVRRVALTDELVLEVREPASEETEALLEALRTLVAKQRR